MHALNTAQAQLIAGQMLTPNVPLCNMALACLIKAPIDAQPFTQAWDDVSQNCDALRIRLLVGETTVSQSTGNSSPVLELLDFSSRQQPDEEARAWMHKNVRTAISLDDVLGNAALIKLGHKRWIFFCNLHHAICDASSFAILWRQLANRYFALQDSSQSAAIASKEDSDFLTFVKATEQAQQSRPKPDYLKKLQDIAPPSPFGTRPKRADTASTRVSITLDAQRNATLATLAALPQARGFGRGMGNSNVLLSLLVTLLYRIGGGSTQTVGLPLPQRKDTAFKNTIGLFVEVLPVQISLDEDTNFATLLEQVRAAFLGLLKEAVAGDSSQLDAQAIPAILNYINAPLGNFGDLPAEVEWLHSGHIDSQHLIRLQVQDWSGDGGITLAFDFNDAVFNEVQRVQTLSAFWKLFDAMAADLQQNIDAVSIAEVRTLGASANSSSTPSDLQTVAACINENCRQLNITPALQERTETLSYAELGIQIRLCAQRMSDAGVGPGSRVAVFMRRDIRLPQILLAIHACGAAYVPLDAEQPATRVQEILSDASPQLLVIGPELIDTISFDNKLELDQLFDAVDSPSTTVDAMTKTKFDSPAATDIAYIIYTSGSTGVPKGVAVTHGALANYCHWAVHFYAQGEAVNMPLFTPVGFDLTVTSLFLPLMTGGTLHIYNELEHPGLDALGAILHEDSVDIVKLTPAHLSTLNIDQCAHTKRLSQLIVGGEDLPALLASRIDKMFDAKVRIHNEYGPTEATVGCVLHTFNAATDKQGSVPIGQPIAFNRLRVLNSAGLDQLPGCPGELYVSGASLANGYWNQQQLTRERFLQLPPHGEHFYRTGDVVREGSDGILHCLGRSDKQFKLRGHRIEPAEIESAALQHPSLQTCVAVLSSRQTMADAADKKCTRCGLASRVPGALMDESGVCEPCRNFLTFRERVDAYFRPMHEFETIASKLKEESQSDYDCIMLLSGGKDSTYALAQLVDMGLRVFAFTLDNGFISQSAKDNAARVCAELGVDHHYGTTPSMNAIFLDSLQRHSNVCNGCFKTIYTLALKLACDLNVNCIVTGLSRGQFFETRLSEDWFLAPDYDAKAMDAAIIAARKAYHRQQDVVSCSMDTEFLKDDSVFERIQIVDFYRYCDVDLEDMYQYLDERLPWIRPADTGRSTNCLINDTGIYVHRYERGFHNYANPYSWDVRLGHKKREDALEELDDDIDETIVHQHLEEIGYQLSEKEPARIALYYSTNTSITQSELRRWLASLLPEWMIPTWLVELPSLPMNLNGKIDRHLLPVPVKNPISLTTSGVPRGFSVSPVVFHEKSDVLTAQSEEEQLLARVWCRHLGIDTVSVSDNFFALGGDSLMAIRIMSELNRAGYPYKPADIFEHQTIAQLAQIELESRTSNTAPSEAADMNIAAEKSAAFSALSGGQLDALSNALNKNKTP